MRPQSNTSIVQWTGKGTEHLRIKKQTMNQQTKKPKNQKTKKPKNQKTKDFQHYGCLGFGEVVWKIFGFLVFWFFGFLFFWFFGFFGLLVFWVFLRFLKFWIVPKVRGFLYYSEGPFPKEGCKQEFRKGVHQQPFD